MTMPYFKNTLSFSKALLVSTLLFSGFANAELTHVSTFIDEDNDCAGYFGANFQECEITHVPTDNSPIFAQIIAKYDAENSNHNEFADGSSEEDWTFNDTSSNAPGTGVEGNWTYTGSYPGINFWVAKASNGFILNWMVDQSEIGSNCVSGESDNNFTLNCLKLSQVVTTGSWATPTTLKAQGNNANDVEFNPGLSHISFYRVPEPTTLALLGLAIMGLSLQRKRNS